MEPPCEHGGVFLQLQLLDSNQGASMEPPCEHGGVYYVESLAMVVDALQWSRRVNTAE